MRVSGKTSREGKKREDRVNMIKMERKKKERFEKGRGARRMNGDKDERKILFVQRKTGMER